MTPLVTIGIPSYNSARWIKGAIESALAQVRVPCEVIVVDDGSSDSSLLYASAFGDRITLLRSAHRGAPFARNQILREAQGEWVQYLDADDYLMPEKIARQLEEAQGGAEADVLYSPVRIETTTQNGIKVSASALDLQKDLYGQWLAWELPQTGGCLWRRRALEELGGWRVEQPCCQEHELYLRALQGGLRFRHTPGVGAVYRIWSQGTLCRKDPRLVVREKTKLIDQLHSWLVAKNLWTEAHRQIAGRACLEMARTLAQTRTGEGARYFRERKKRGLITFHGPAAPSSYRAAVRLLGFSGAEVLARMLRT